MSKYITIVLLVSLMTGCNKMNKGTFKKEKDCSKLEGFHKFIYEPIVISEDCNCIVSGKVKYLKDCETQVLIHYGQGECDDVATKIICKNGDCYDENKVPFETYDYTLDCNGNSIVEGPISPEELERLYDENSGPQP